jgi:hypothetical protein
VQKCSHRPKDWLALQEFGKQAGKIPAKPLRMITLPMERPTKLSLNSLNIHTSQAYPLA